MPQRKRKNKKLLIFECLIFVCLVVVAVWFAVRGNTDTQNSNDNTSQSNVPQVEEEVKIIEQKDGESDEEFAERVVEEKEVKQYEGENTSSNNELSGTISYAEVMNGNLNLNVNIDQFLSEGKCELNILQNGTEVYTETAGIMNLVSTSVCNGFEIPLTELPKGSLQINVKVSSDGKTGTITREVNI